MAIEMEAPKVKETKKPNVNVARDKDREKVRGIFHFYEVPGGRLEFCFKAYKDDKIERYDMYDGQIYEIPLGVAKHLNKNGWYPEYEYVAGEKGLQGGHSPDGRGMRIGKKVRRFSFQSLEFVDTADLTPNGEAPQVHTVEYL
jgi:hypothetical protein